MNKATAIRYCYKGVWGTLPELAKACKMNPATVRNRMKRGYTFEQAVDRELWEAKAKKQEKASVCDAWGNDCFNCKLPDCNDDRPCRRNEVRYVPETEGIKTESNTATYTVLLGTNRR